VIRRYGWRRDLPDHRDVHLVGMGGGRLPAMVDLRETGHLPPVYDQGQLGSCTANALAAAVDFELHRQGLPWMTPSRLFIYYSERRIERTVYTDAGAQIRDGIKVVARQGVCPEQHWPYVVARFAEEPPLACYQEATRYEAVQYARVGQTLGELRAVLAAGTPVVCGISVYPALESDEVAATGVVPMPAADEAPLGGHAILVVGYDDTTQRFTVRNSWGADWGDRGHFTLPYRYLTDRGLAADFWTITAVSGAASAVARHAGDPGAVLAGS
jgi:C1A family cysteine protease